jgi:hypothetical protein
MVNAKIGGLLRTIAQPLVLMGGGILGVGVVKNLVDTGREAEQTQLTIASLMQKVTEIGGGPVIAFGQARRAAQQLREEFIRLAIASPATSQEIERGYQDVAFFLSRAGLTLREQAVAARDIAVADMQSLTKGTVARDVRQILGGQFSMMMIQTPALKSELGRAAAKLAKDGETKRAFEILSRLLAPSAEALEAWKSSFTGLASTASDKLLLLKRRAAVPLMEYLTTKLTEIGGMLGATGAEESADKIGAKIVEILGGIEEGVKTIAKHWDGIVTTGKVLVGALILGKLISGFAGLAAFSGKVAASIGRWGPLAAEGLRPVLRMVAAQRVLAAGIGAMIGVAAGDAINRAYGASPDTGNVLSNDYVGSGGLGSIVQGQSVMTTPEQRQAWYDANKVAAKAVVDDLLDTALGAGGAGAGGAGTKVGSAKIRARKATISIDQADMGELFRLLAPPLRAAMRGQPFSGGTGSGLGFVSLPLANGARG